MEGFWIKKARQRMAQGDAAGALRLMRVIVCFPFILSNDEIANAHYLMGQVLMQEKEYAGAAEQWQWLLTNILPARSKGHGGLEADVRRHLADTLEALGRRAEADTERQKAANSLAGGRETMLAHFSRGKLLKERGKHAEAYAEFEHALSLVKPKDTTLQTSLMVELASAASRSGQPVRCCEWAEAAIANGAEEASLTTSHVLAGTGYLNRGDLQDAERHIRQAVMLTEQMQSPNDRRGLLANLLHKQGRTGEAIALCDELIANHPNPLVGARSEYLVKAQVLRDLGRFDEALEVARRLQTLPINPPSSSERHKQAMCLLSMAITAAEAGYADQALKYLQEATQELGKDERVGLWLAAIGASIHAQRGNRQDSLPLRDVVLKNVASYSQDHQTMLLLHAHLGTAAYYLEDWPQCRQTWETYLAFKPYPVSLPLAHYYLGECARMDGDFSQAADFYRQAQTVNPDLHFAKLAAERLRELPA